jgi:ADP-ribose pyrophosphatase
MSSYQVLKSEIKYPGRAFTVRRDTLRMPDGREATFDIVDHAGSVVILPVDQDGNILFVRQHRHPVDLDLLELPAGMLNTDEDPETCARRELREETGMAAKVMELLGRFYLAPGYSTEYMSAYLATELHPGPLPADQDEFLTLERIPVPETLVMVERGGLLDAKSLAVICLARRRMEGWK